MPGSQTGRLTATISGSTITYRLQATGTGLTMSHFHSGAAGTNGPVVAFLFGPDTNGVNSIDVGGTITVDSLVGPMKGDMDAFLAALRAGTIYANVHSIAYPGGVVRAQIPAVTIPGAPGTGTGLANSSGGIDTFMLGVVLAGAALLAAGATGVFAVRGRNR
ncbi:MAG: CHRD domain-containing protein [Chloroflexi bacterium]|nr:CHRD domain-containing protein [Chloroflexota bacterium]